MVKISDFGMSRTTNEYKPTQTTVPFRWFVCSVPLLGLFTFPRLLASGPHTHIYIQVEQIFYCQLRKPGSQRVQQTSACQKFCNTFRNFTRKLQETVQSKRSNNKPVTMYCDPVLSVKIPRNCTTFGCCKVLTEKKDNKINGLKHTAPHTHTTQQQHTIDLLLLA